MDMLCYKSSSDKLQQASRISCHKQSRTQYSALLIGFLEQAISFKFMELPSTMKALVLKSTSEPPSIQIVATPQAEHGSAVVRVLSAGVISYMGDIYNGRRPYPFPKPMVPGSAGIGRVAATGPDATKLKPGDLVFIDGLVRSRDEPTDAFLPGLHDGQSPGSRRLMQDVWRD